MHKDWKATTGGIMCLIAGTWGVMSGVMLMFITSSYPTAWIRFNPFQTVILNRLAPLGIALGLVAILGGICALNHRRWGLALAGAICAAMIPPPLFVGVLAIVFIAIGREEFREEEELVSFVSRDRSFGSVSIGCKEHLDPPESIETDSGVECVDSTS